MYSAVSLAGREPTDTDTLIKIFGDQLISISDECEDYYSNTSDPPTPEIIENSESKSRGKYRVFVILMETPIV